MTESMLLKFPFPSVSQAGTMVEAVTVKRPKLKTLKAMEKATSDLDSVSALVAGVTGLSLVDVDELDPVDFQAISKQATDFLSESGLVDKTGAA